MHLLVLALFALFALSAPALAGTAPSVGDCDALVEREPGKFASYACYYDMAHRHGAWRESIDRLEARLRRVPDDQNARACLGQLEAERLEPRGITLLEEAVAGFADAGDARAEVHTRVVLRYHLDLLGRYAEAEEVLARAAEIAARSGEPDVVREARIGEGWAAYVREQYAEARRIFDALAAEGLPDWPSAWQRSTVREGRAAVAWAEGRLDEAHRVYLDAAAAQAAAGDAFAAAAASVTAAGIAYDMAGAGTYGSNDAREEAGAAARAAHAAGHREAEFRARARLAGDPLLPIAERIAQAAAALDAGHGAARADDVVLLRLTLARLVEERGGPGARQGALSLVDEAMAEAQASGLPYLVARAFMTRADIAADARSPHEIEADLAAAADTVDRWRDEQGDRSTRARFLWGWRRVYDRLAAHFFAAGRVDDGLHAMERLKARAALDYFAAAGATEAVRPAASGAADLALAVDEIGRARRALSAPGREADERAALRAGLDAAVRRVSDAHEQLAAQDPRYGAVVRPRACGARDVQSALGPGEALLAFQIVPFDDPLSSAASGGSWVVVLTRETAQAMRLTYSPGLADRASAYLGLVARRDAREENAAARLYDDVLRAAVEALPPDIERLVVIPDGVLSRLPLAALLFAGAPPLASRFEVGEVPSATEWLRLRSSPASAGAQAVLSFADPDLGGLASTQPGDRAALGPIPAARAEGRELSRALGGSGTLRVGGAASEAALGNERLADYRIIHLAAHAVLDEREPRRTAVMLARGEEGDDGRLTVEELLTLDLGGAVVILSACSSAGGELTAGEGVVGLARAALYARASAVVGSLWPLRDDEAARLVVAFARRLGAGDSVGAALADARRESIATGAPVAAWAGLVVVGDPAATPFPGGIASSSTSWGLVFGIVVLALVPAGWIAARRARVKSSRPR